MTQPDERIRQSVFNQSITHAEDSILSSPRLNAVEKDDNHAFADGDHPLVNNSTVYSRDVNGKMKMSAKITNWEQDRVAKHKAVRENQLSI